MRGTTEAAQVSSVVFFWPALTNVAAMPIEVQCVADVHAVLGEGPVWVARENALYWVDIKGRRIFRLTGDRELTSWETPLRVGSLAPCANGGFIGGTEDGIALIDPAAGRYDILHDPEAHLPDNRFNDGKVDRRGRFWAGSMDDREAAATGTLYVLGGDSAPVPIDREYQVTNGPAFSPAGNVMYHNDSARAVTYAFDIGADGGVANRRSFLQFGPGEGYPDGMTVDAEGCLWVAFWDGWCVRRYSPGGAWLETIRTPVARPTSCAFGGPNFENLYITSASIGLDAEARVMQPNAGGLFMCVPGVRGLPDIPFAG